jgi:hypothetical protein
MIHRDSAVKAEVMVLARTDEGGVWRYWSVGVDAGTLSLLNRRGDDAALFVAEKSILPCMRIEAEHNNTGSGDAKVNA